MTKTCSDYFKPEKAGYLPKLCCRSCHEDVDEGYALCSLEDDEDSRVCCAVLIAREERYSAGVSSSGVKGSDGSLSVRGNPRLGNELKNEASNHNAYTPALNGVPEITHPAMKWKILIVILLFGALLRWIQAHPNKIRFGSYQEEWGLPDKSVINQGRIGEKKNG